MMVWAENVHRHRLRNGLHLYLVDKPGSQVQFIKLIVRFGSMHTRYRPSAGAEWRSIPSATPHFLEHVLFREADESILARFQALGATANAGVSYTSTSFDVLCVEKLEPCLAEVMAVVANGDFPEEGVDLEREIIGQEIDIWAEHPDWQLEQALMRGLYAHHSVRESILGTREELQALTRADLIESYEAFYRASNMSLVIVAEGASEDRTFALVERYASALRVGEAPEISQRPEPEHATSQHMVVRVPGVNPRFILGFKDYPAGLSGAELTRREALVEVAAESLFGHTSPILYPLLDQGLLDGVPEVLSECHEDLGFCHIRAGSANPDRASDALLEETQRALDGHLTESHIDRARRQIMGEAYMRLDDHQNAGYVVGELYLRGAMLGDYLQALKDATAQDVIGFAREYFRPERACRAVLLPPEEESSP